MPSKTLHPEHEPEQIYLERIHAAHEKRRKEREQLAESGADRHAARALRKKAMESLAVPVDLDALCFGRIDTEDGLIHYLGRGAVHEDNKLLVINWAQPAAQPFYTATPAEPEGLALRRRFQLDQLRLLGIIDERFTESATAPLVDQPEQDDTAGEQLPPPPLIDAILAEMDRARGTSLGEMVATIETRQYELISDSIDGILCIQGAPGSGKTAIALHRAAWLLYNHRDELERTGVLVVGPNRAFMEYVAQVLPSLGETLAVQTVVDRLHHLEDVRVRATEPRASARLKGDLRMADAIQDAVRDRVRAPEADVEISVDRIRVALTATDIGELIQRAWSEQSTYLAARAVFRDLLVAAVVNRIPEARGIFRNAPGASEVAPEVVRIVVELRRRIPA